MNQWRKPNSEEAARGFVAMLPMVYHCEVNGRLMSINYSRGYTDRETKIVYPKIQRWQGYTEAMLIRRASWSKDLPQWWKLQEQEDKDAAWLHYIETGVASKEVQETLETLGSYKQEIAA